MKGAGERIGVVHEEIWWVDVVVSDGVVFKREMQGL